MKKRKKYIFNLRKLCRAASLEQAIEHADCAANKYCVSLYENEHCFNSKSQFITESRTISKLHLAVFQSSIAVISELLNDININTKDCYGLTPLHDAVIFGRVKVVEFLINAGADINAKDNWHEGYTPWHEAMRLGHKKIAKILINAGADKSIKCNEEDCDIC